MTSSYTITAGSNQAGDYVYFVDGAASDVAAEIIRAGIDADRVAHSLSHLLDGEIVQIEHDREYIHVMTDAETNEWIRGVTVLRDTSGVGDCWVREARDGCCLAAEIEEEIAEGTIATRSEPYRSTSGEYFCWE